MLLDKDQIGVFAVSIRGKIDDRPGLVQLRHIDNDGTMDDATDLSENKQERGLLTEADRKVVHTAATRLIKGEL